MGNRTGMQGEWRRIGLVILGTLCVAAALVAMTVGAGGSAGDHHRLRATVELVDSSGERVGTAKLVEHQAVGLATGSWPTGCWSSPAQASPLPGIWSWST